MNFTTLIMVSLGLLILWLTLVKPCVALFIFVFSLMAFNDYLGDDPNSVMKIGENQFYAADFFLILLAAGLIRSILRKDLNSRVDKALLVMMLVSVGVGIVAILIGLDYGHKSNIIIGDFRRYSYYPWAMFIPAMFLKNNWDIRVLERWAYGASAVICAIAAYRVITGSSYRPLQHATEWGYFRAMSYHDCLILIFVICIAIGKVLDTKEQPSLLPKVCLVVLPIFVILSNYRMDWFLMIVCSSVVLIILRRGGWGRSQMSLKQIMRFASLGIFLIAAVCFTGEISGSRTYLEVKRRIDQRVLQFDWLQQEGYRDDMWKEAIKEWEKSPLLGLGYGKRFYFEHQTQEGWWFWLEAENLHNRYLELLLKSGVLGLTIFLCLHLLILARCWRLIRICPDETPLVAAGIAFMIAVLLQAATQPLLGSPNSIVVSYLIIGSVLSLYFFPRPTERSGTKLQTPKGHGVPTTQG